MKYYGMAYQGSKNFIAKELIARLPSGNRFVDLFGGGGAMTHIASLSNKYNELYYNEISFPIFKTFSDIFSGNLFTPDRVNHWVTKEEFNENYKNDGFLQVVWSFAGNQHSYIYSDEVAPYKKALHYAFYYNDFSLLKEFGIHTDFINKHLILVKMKEWGQKYINYRIKEGLSIKTLKVESSTWRRLQTIDNLDRLYTIYHDVNKDIHCTHHDYREYEYEKGDVVYCDSPYYNSAGYSERDFDTIEYLDWVHKQPYRIYFSNYFLPPNINKDRFKIVWKRDKISTFASTNSSYRVEHLYTQNKKCKYDNKLIMERLF